MNENIFLFFYNLAHRNEFFDRIVVFITEPVGLIILGLIGLYMVSQYKDDQKYNLKIILLIFGPAVIAILVATVFKLFFHQLRPFAELPSVVPLIDEKGYAFPSGHATFFSALTISFFLFKPKIGAIFIFVALLIGISRVIAGVHYPFDILGGFALGGLTVYFSKRFLNKFNLLQS
jgi:undecaprenyl-diphosphatase